MEPVLMGWRGYNRTDMPTAWTIEDGAIKINGSGRGEAGQKTAATSSTTVNSKILNSPSNGKFLPGETVAYFIWLRKFPADLFMNRPPSIRFGYERHPDAKLGKNGNRKSASLYDLVPANPQNAKPAGEWNTGGIMVYQCTVVHSQNGENVVEYHLWTDDWKKMVADSINQRLARISQCRWRKSRGYTVCRIMVTMYGSKHQNQNFIIQTSKRQTFS
jgi:hypothetical protein